MILIKKNTNTLFTIDGEHFKSCYNYIPLDCCTKATRVDQDRTAPARAV